MNKLCIIFTLGIVQLSNLSSDEPPLKVPYVAKVSEKDGQRALLDSYFLIGDTSNEKKKKVSKSLRLSHKDHLPTNSLKEEDVCYLEGYIQALIDANYYETYVLVSVGEDRTVYLYNLPSDQRIRNSIITFVADLPSIKAVKSVELNKEVSKKIKEKRYNYRLSGVWFPETTVLFEPLIANPRDPVYSIAYRWGDQVLAPQQIAISLGDIFPIYRFFDVYGGDLQIDIFACMWANFNMNPSVQTNDEWAELVTSDYILAIPLSYSKGNFSYRLKIYHISSHLGDEYMVNNPMVLRTNPSFEAIDFFISYQFKESLRLYAGPGFVINSDNSFPMKTFYAEYGLEFRPFVYKFRHPRLYGVPFLAIDCQNWEANNYRPSLTIQLGYEWSKLERAGRNVRIFFEYHNGYSEGQFFDQFTDYFAIRGAWGF
jgi:hypothetical protein